MATSLSDIAKQLESLVKKEVVGVAETGYEEGYETGRNEGCGEGYDEGYTDGHQAGYKEAKAKFEAVKSASRKTKSGRRKS